MIFCPLRASVLEFEIPPRDHSMRMYFFEGGLINLLTRHEVVGAVSKVSYEFSAPKTFG